VPFVVYADFECYTKKLHDDSKTESTAKYQKHVPSGFCFKIVSSHEMYNKPAVIYRGQDVVETFLNSLIQEEREIIEILKQIVPMKISADQEKDFQAAMICHICGKILGSDRVRDHDHLTGHFRGAAHNACNLNFRFSKENDAKKDSYFIPVIFHNLRGYDSHLIMESIGKFKEKRLTCLPNNFEKYISFSLGNLRFIDSYQFLSAPLHKLVINLRVKGEESFIHLANEFKTNTNLLLRKGIYPYDYVDNEEKMSEIILPPKEAFYNILNDEHITDDEYSHAVKIWETFQCKDLGDYHDLYLRTDVLLLADVFENFRNLCLSVYKLDPAHYYTSPGLSWDAMLKYTGVELELLEDIDMHLMVEAGLRGGVSMISNKFAKANNHYLTNYDSTEPNSYIAYLDANNLYGWAMSQYLPEKDFVWMVEEEINNFDVSTIEDNSDIGYILEVDLTYPEDIHNLHNDYPLAPESLAVHTDILSPYTKKLIEKLNMKHTNVSKLIPNLNNKSKYVLHYQNLKLYLRLGLKLEKIHRGVSFRQSPWLQPYINLNTEMRKQAGNDFEKDFYKLMNNSVFGKTMENLRKRTNIELVHSPRRMQKLVAKPTMDRFKIFNADLVGVHTRKNCLKMNCPTYVGFSILDISKTLMYSFHYDYIKPRYGNNIKLLFADTDSLCYHIATEDVYQDWSLNTTYFDFSDYPSSHKLYSIDNKKVIGKFKDETASIPIEEFIGLRSKMYSLKYGAIEKKTAKGISKVVINKQLRHSIYKDCLINSVCINSSMNQIRSINHQLYSVNICKLSLSPFDDKRFVLEDGVNTLAHGHYSTR
jgi:hypothetical protein